MTIRKRLTISFMAIIIIFLVFGLYMNQLYHDLETNMNDVNIISGVIETLQETRLCQASFVKSGEITYIETCSDLTATLTLEVDNTTLVNTFEETLNTYDEILLQFETVRLQIVDSQKYANELMSNIIALLSSDEYGELSSRNQLLTTFIKGVQTAQRYDLFGLTYDSGQLFYITEIQNTADAMLKTAYTVQDKTFASELSKLSASYMHVNKDLITLNNNLASLSAQLDTLMSAMIGNLDHALNDLHDQNQHIATRVRMVYMSLFGIVVFMVIYVLTSVTSRINTSLKALIAGTAKIAEGDYRDTLAITGNDEFTILFQSVNGMAETLKNAHNAIVQYNNQLEKMVDDKTLELRQTKDDLEDLNRKLTQEKEKYVILAMTDALTGLKNRAFLISYLEQTIKEAQRYNSTFAIMLLDIDFFKRVNDQYGHHTGDDVLKQLAEVLNIECRQSDVISRYGGEEFVIIFANTTLDNAIAIAERIRLKVAQTAFTELQLHITISAGVTEYRGDPLSVLLERVDGLQYQAKSNGRNCIVHD